MSFEELSWQESLGIIESQDQENDMKGQIQRMIEKELCDIHGEHVKKVLEIELKQIVRTK